MARCKTDSDAAIQAHIAAHDAKVLARRKARISANIRKKKRGLQAAVHRMMEQRVK